MSVRVDSTLIASSVVVGHTGLGVLAENLPQSGEDGAGFFAHEPSLPADNGKETRALITSAPSGANVTLFDADENGVFVLIVTADGTYTIEYDYYEDGVFQNSGSLDVVIGGGAGGGTILGTLNPIFGSKVFSHGLSH